MKSALAKIAVRKALGLYIGEREVVLSEVAGTPLGPVEVASREESYATADELGPAIEHLLATEPGKKRRRISIAVAFPLSRVFFDTRPLRSGAEVTPESLVQKMLSSSGIAVEDLTIDLLTSSGNKQTLATVAAARRKYVTNVVAAMRNCCCQPVRAEPAACGLARAAAQQHRTPRRAKTVLRVFLGAETGLAVLMNADMPLFWRTFRLFEGAEGLSIASIVRTLRMQTTVHGIELSVQYVLIHGRPELHDRLEKEGLPADIGVRTLWCEGPTYDNASLAYGTAIGGLDSDARGFDLARNIKSRPPLREIFPWGELACQVAMVVCFALVLFGYKQKSDTQYAMAMAECNRNEVCAKTDAKELQKEKSDLIAKTKVLKDFLDTRILWTDYTRHVASTLAPSARLDSFEGQCTFSGGAKGKAGKGRKSLVLRARAPLMPDGSVPADVSDFFVSLKNDPLLKRDFASVQVTDLRRIQSKGSQEANTSFMVICLPESKKPGAGH